MEGGNILILKVNHFTCLGSNWEELRIQKNLLQGIMELEVKQQRGKNWGLSKLKKQQQTEQKTMS